MDNNEKWYGSAAGIAAVAFIVIFFGAGIAALAAQWLVVFAVLGLLGGLVVAARAASRSAARHAGRVVGRTQRYIKSR